MGKIIKNNIEYSGIPLESVTAWAPTGDPVQVKEPLMGNTDISEIGDGTITGAISSLNSKLTLLDSATTASNHTNLSVDVSAYDALWICSVLDREDTPIANQKLILLSPFGGSFVSADLDDTSALVAGVEVINNILTRVRYNTWGGCVYGIKF